MKNNSLKTYFAPILLVTAMGSSGIANAAVIGLFDYAMNIDGITYEHAMGDTLPASVGTSLFDFNTGLGELSVLFTTSGNHSVDFFVDHEIDEATNTWWNESGAANGIAAAGQSWEIDEPGYVFGDIYDNLLAGSLDNTNSVPSGLEDDVSMAMGWDFTLDATHNGIVTFSITDIAPSGGFFLSQTDPDSQASVYFSSSFETLIKQQGGQIPEPGSLLLMGIGLAGMGAYRRKRSSK